jgi:YVTN family beta-propeller protein
MSVGRKLASGAALLAAGAAVAPLTSANGAARAGAASRFRDGTVSVISTRSNRVAATVRVGPDPVGVAVVPGRTSSDSQTLFVLNANNQG